MSEAIHVVAMGARTPLGLGAASSAAAIRAGISRTRLHEEFVDPAGEPLRAALDATLDPWNMGARRLAALLPSALCEVLEAIAPCVAEEPIPLLLALPETRPGFTEAHERALLQQIAGLRLSRQLRMHRVAERGHAAGIVIIQRAARLIDEGRHPLVIVGGVDSYLDADTIDWLGRERRLATRHTRASFIPGEGTGFLALAGERLQRARRLPSLAVVYGIGSAQEPTAGSIESDPVDLARGLIAAIDAAVANLPAGARIERVLSDLNGERPRSEEWGLVNLARHNLFARSGECEAPAAQWGDMGAATGPLLAVLALQAWARGYHRGVYTLLFASSDAGLRGAALLVRPRGDR